MSFVLIGPSVSPWVKRARCCLMEKQIEFEVDPYAPVGGAPEAEFLAVSPLGKVPALRHGDFSIADSLAICFYVEKLVPEPALIPSAARSLAWALWISTYADALFSRSEAVLFTHRVLRPAFGQQPDPAAVDAALVKLPGLLSYLDTQIEGRQFFVDDTLSIADISVCAVLIGLHHAGEPVDAEQYPALSAFYDRTTSRDAFRRLLIEDQAVLERLRKSS